MARYYIKRRYYGSSADFAEYDEEGRKKGGLGKKVLGGAAAAAGIAGAAYGARKGAKAYAKSAAKRRVAQRSITGESVDKGFGAKVAEGIVRYTNKPSKMVKKALKKRNKKRMTEGYTSGTKTKKGSEGRRKQQIRKEKLFAKEDKKYQKRKNKDYNRQLQSYIGGNQEKKEQKQGREEYYGPALGPKGQRYAPKQKKNKDN